ncbi:hypothetical protein QA612_22150 [Evansella sp. AB-P1]|nr:hypothetical protein [Evansella sp. AB-P1]MDG5790145.1 hypothetical protein [Evansella sp. AB-P1]
MFDITKEGGLDFSGTLRKIINAIEGERRRASLSYYESNHSD